VTELAAFAAVALVVICTPGPDTALTIRNSLIGGRRAGVFTALGVSTGQAIWTLTASAGVAALLVASEPAFRALKLIGAAYLIWLGAQTLWRAFRRRAREDHVAATSVLEARQAWRQGLISNLGNPKMAAFFTSLLPQFGDASFAAMLGFGLLFCAMTFAWLTGYAFVVAKAGDVLRRDRVRRAINVVMGGVLVAFGLRLATERRT
jgi:threonine/homoserine/homoserine lactone efflux protein